MIVSLVLILPVAPGICTGLFLQCMGALLNPANRMKKGIRWGLAVHTIAIFSLATMSFAVEFDLGSIIFVSNREFPGNDEFPSGPFGYLYTFRGNGILIPIALVFPLNQWLADGLLVSFVPILITTPRFMSSSPQLYRCLVLYSASHWLIGGFLSLLYLASIGMSSDPLQNGQDVNVQLLTSPIQRWEFSIPTRPCSPLGTTPV